MPNYSDTAQEVLNRMLERLEPDLLPQTIAFIKESLEQGTFDNVDEIMTNIVRLESGVEQNAN